MVKGTSFSFCVVTSVITHAVCNSIVSLFRQIWDSRDCAHTGRMGGSRTWRVQLGPAPPLSPRGWQGLIFSGVCLMWVLQGIQDQVHSPSFFPGSSMLP